MTSQGFVFVVAEPVCFDPGITGFVKASRHFTGAALVMTREHHYDGEWVGIFWVPRLAHNAWRYSPQCYRVLSEKTLQAAERTFDYMLASGPPPGVIRDSQRRRVYDWEDDNVLPLDGQSMSWEGCNRFTKYVWDRVGIGNPLELIDLGSAKSALSYGGRIGIPTANPAYRTKPIILHEIGHELTEQDKHGPRFVSMYMDLCVRFLGMNRRELEDAASRYGVNYSTRVMA